MKKAELIDLVSMKTNSMRSDVELIVNEFLDSIEKEVIKGNEVKLSSFGVFYKKNRLARKGTNPSNGAIITIPANSTLGFRPSKNLKAKLNK